MSKTVSNPYLQAAENYLATQITSETGTHNRELAALMTFIASIPAGHPHATIALNRQALLISRLKMNTTDAR